MRSKKQRLKLWKIYPVLDSAVIPDKKELFARFLFYIKMPVDAVQLRFDIFERGYYELARRMVAVAGREGVPVLINDRPEIALSLRASGVHLGKADTTVSMARSILGSGAIIGRTIRGLEDYSAVRREAPDYVSVGPVFRTPAKKDLKPVGIDALRSVLKASDLPVVAIGGITDKNVKDILSAGGKCFAFIRLGLNDGKMAKLKKIIQAA